MQATPSVLSLLTPAAAWAALLVPLLIHLFSRSRGRLVHIGHIDLVRRAQRIQVTEIKLTRWVLLLVRLAIFALAAMILAGLSTAGLKSSSAATVYLTPAWVMNASQADFYTALETFVANSGSRAFLLKPGYPEADLQQLARDRQPAQPGGKDFSNAWSLLAERLSIEHHAGTVTVFATDHLLQFGPRRPTLPRAVDWRITPSRQSTPTGDMPTRVLIAHDRDRTADAATIRAALGVLKEHRLPGLLWESLDSARLGETGLDSDWLIHLGDTGPTPAQLAGFSSATVILSDTGGGAIEKNRQLISLPFFPYTTFRLDQYGRYADGVADETAVTDGSILAATADGSPLLQEFHYPGARVLKFNSRFDPRWSSVAQQPEFPELLLQLMTGSALETQRFADARINPANLQLDREDPSVSIPLPRRSLQTLLATLLTLLWILERWLSERKTRAVV